MAGNTVTLTFAGDSSSLEKSFQQVGSKAISMAGDLDKAEAKSRSFGGAMDSAGEAAGGAEGKFMGAADLLDGLGGAFGLPTEKATGLFRAFGDLSGGFEAIQPMIGSLGTMFTSLGSTLITPPVGIILLIGALAAALVVAYQKSETFRNIVNGVFDGVKTTVGSVVGVFESVGSAIGGAFTTGVAVAKSMINALIGAVESGLNFIMTPYRMSAGFLNKIPGVGSAVPDFLTRDIHLPRLHTGGVVPGPAGAEVPILALAGETVTPPGGAVGNVTIVVNGNLVHENQLADLVQSVLLRKQKRTPLGFAT